MSRLHVNSEPRRKNSHPQSERFKYPFYTHHRTPPRHWMPPSVLSSGVSFLQKPDSTESDPRGLVTVKKKIKSAAKQSTLERKNRASIAELCMNDKTLMSTSIPQTDTVSCAGWFNLTCTSEVYHHWSCTGWHSIGFVWELGQELQQKCLRTCGSPLKYLIKAARGQNSQSTYCTFILGLFVLLWYSMFILQHQWPCMHSKYVLPFGHKKEKNEQKLEDLS